MQSLAETLHSVRVRVESGAAPPEPATEPATPACVACGGIGWTRRAGPLSDPDFGKAFPCKVCWTPPDPALVFGKVREESGLHITMIREFTFDSFEPANESLARALDAARGFAESPAGWLVIIGGCGVGKTHLAVAVAAAHAEDVIYTSSVDLLDSLRATFDPAVDVHVSTLIDRARNALVLVVDDFEMPREGWGAEKMIQILGYRHDRRLATLLAMREMPAGDDPLGSRLADRRIVKLAPIVAEDYRRRKFAR